MFLKTILNNKFNNIFKDFTPKHYITLGINMLIYSVMISQINFFELSSDTFNWSLINIKLYQRVFIICMLLNFFIIYRNRLYENRIYLILSYTIIAILMLFYFPVISSDLFPYIARGRMVSLYGKNPYIYTYSQFKFDDLYSYLGVAWSNSRTVYGPVFLNISALLSFIGQKSIILSILAFKAGALIANTCSIYLISKLTKSNKAVFLYALNPFFIVELLGELHLDVYLVALLLSSIYFYTKQDKKSALTGNILLLSSILTKYITAILAPFLVIYISSKEPELRKRIQLIFYMGVSAVILTVYFFYPYWNGVDTFGRVHELLRMQATPSPLIILISSVTKLLNITDISSQINIGRFIFLIIYIYYLLKFFIKKRNYEELLIAMSISSLSFVLLVFSWWHYWYLITPITLLILYVQFDKKYTAELILLISTFFIVYF